jgi:hypothetical protein
LERRSIWAGISKLWKMSATLPEKAWRYASRLPATLSGSFVMDFRSIGEVL